MVEPYRPERVLLVPLVIARLMRRGGLEEARNRELIIANRRLWPSGLKASSRHKESRLLSLPCS